MTHHSLIASGSEVKVVLSHPTSRLWSWWKLKLSARIVSGNEGEHRGVNGVLLFCYCIKTMYQRSINGSPYLHLSWRRSCCWTGGPALDVNSWQPVAKQVTNCHDSTRKCSEYLELSMANIKDYPWEFLSSANWVSSRVRSFNNSNVRVYCVLTDSILADDLTCDSRPVSQ